MIPGETTCPQCGSDQCNVHYSSGFDSFLSSNIPSLSFQRTSGHQVYRLSEKAAELLTQKAIDGSIVELAAIPNDEMNYHSQLECSQCGFKWESDFQWSISNGIYSALSRKYDDLRLQYSSAALGADLSNVRSMLGDYSWQTISEQILRQIAPEKWKQLERIQAVRDVLPHVAAGGKGGGEYISLAVILSGIAAGVASRFVYDLLSKVFSKVRQQVTKMNTKRIANATLRSLQPRGAGNASDETSVPSRYTEDIESIIRSMPKSKRQRIIRAIAQQHARNIQKQLIDAMERKDRA